MYWNAHNDTGVDAPSFMMICPKGFLIGLSVAILIFFSFSPGEGANSSDLKEEITQERLHLEQLNREIAETKKKASQVKKKHGSVLKKIESLDRRLYRHKQEQSRLNTQIKEIDLKLADLNTKISQLDAQIKKNQASVSARLRLLYMEGRAGYLRTLFAADSFVEALQRVDYLAWVAQREGQIVRQFQEDMTQIHRLKEQQSQNRESLLQLQGQTQQSIQEISGLKRKKRTVLVRLSKEKDTHERTVEDLKQSAEQVDSIPQGSRPAISIGSIPFTNDPWEDPLFGLLSLAGFKVKSFHFLVGKNIQPLTRMSTKKALKSRPEKGVPSNPSLPERWSMPIGSRDMGLS